MGIDVCLERQSCVRRAENDKKCWMGRLSTVSQVLIPTLYACSRSGRASASFKTQSCHAGSPYDMAPRMTFETFSPDFPRLKPLCQREHHGRGAGAARGAITDFTYSILIASVDEVRRD